MGAGVVMLASWVHVRPSMTRMTPVHPAVSPMHDWLPPSSQLYEMNTIDGRENSSPPPPKVATIGVPRMFLCIGNGSPTGGPSHSHCASGKNTPGTTSRVHMVSNVVPVPTPNGTHTCVVTSQ